MKAITELSAKAASRRWLQNYQAPLRGWLTLCISAGVVQGLAIIGQMGLLAWLAQSLLIDGQSLGSATTALLVLAGCILLRSLALLAQELAAQQLSSRARQGMRVDLSRFWARQGPVKLAADSSARLANLWLEQVDAVDGYYARYLPQQWLAVIQPLLILLVVFWLDWLAGLFLLFSAPLIPLFMALVGMRAEQISQRHVLQAGRLAGHFLDRVRNLTSLQLFGQQRASIAAVAQQTDSYRQLSMATLKVAFLSSAVLEFFASVAIAVVAMYIGFGLLGYIDYGPSAQLSLFSGLFILLLAPEFFQPLRSLAQHYHDRANALGAAAQLAASRQPVAEAAQPAPAAIDSDTDAVIVDQLALAHQGRQALFNQVSFRLLRGQTLLISGPSGAGKSSLLQCLAGFIQPQQGHISLFGQPPGQQAVAWLGQSSWLVKGSWKDNLRLLAPDASEAAMLEALARVGLQDRLQRAPQRLDSALDDNGRGLSGGQARRLALARIWLSPAELVLLDEPTAGLDADSEQQVLDALSQLKASGRSLIVVSHHPALQALADQHLILAQGRLQRA